MKIGIVNVYSRDIINYGNVFQTYALNRFLRDIYPDAQIETILWNNKSCIKITSYIRAIRYKIISMFQGSKPITVSSVTRGIMDNLKKHFRYFADNNIIFSDKIYSLKDMHGSDYDVVIVGSDVVWMQSRCLINRILFLDFHAKKISYAASFGRNFIPKENIKFVKKYLDDFFAISVRECESISLLTKIGVSGAVQVLDPTLLLSLDIWKSIESKSDIFEQHYDRNCKYAFIYLLKQNTESFDQIISFCRRNNLISIFVPCIDLSYDSSMNFADLTIEDCPPEEWLWLLHNSECVITDSFHGAVLSTVYKKKFFVVSRIHGVDLNMRMIDYLHLIKNSDKMVDIGKVKMLSDYEWDYDSVDKILRERRDYSIEFLKNAIGQGE